MKKTLTAIMITIFLLTPVLCFSAYRIHLKDGREFTTDRYWEDGEQIKFERFGGVIGMQKELVREIEEVEYIPEQGETELETFPQFKTPVGDQESDTQKPPEDAVKAKVSKPAANVENRSLIDQCRASYNTITEEFKKVPMMGKEELHKYADELISLKKTIISNHLADTFSKELIKIYAMLDEVEEFLRQKGY